MDESEINQDVIRIRFDGGLADDNRIPLPEFVESLEGWQNFLDITASMFAQGRLTLEKQKAEHRPRFEVRAIRESSVEVEIIGWATWAIENLAAGALQGMGLAAIVKLWKLRESIFKQQVSSRLDNATIEESAAALAELAKQNDITPGPDDDPIQVTEAIDRSIKRGLRPVNISIDRVTILNASTNVLITATSVEKSAIEKPYADVSQSEIVEEPEERKVFLREIDVDKKTASFRFEEPQNEDEKGTKRGRITDPRIARAKDPYTGALHERSSMTLIVQKKLLNSKTRAVRWELSLHQTETQPSLFTT